MSEQKLRIAGILAGDIENHPATRVKFRYFFDALSHEFTLVDICDVSLHGMARYWNAAQVFHPNLKCWKKRYWENNPAFRARSRRASACVRSLAEKVDAIMQVSLLFDSNWKPSVVPIFVYTDFTVRLSARCPEGGRSPYSPRQIERCVDMERRGYERAVHIFTRGEFVRHSIIEDYGIAPAQVTAVGGGMNLASFPAASQKHAGDPPVAFFVGRDFYRKGGDILLKAFSIARETYPTSKLLVMTRDRVPRDLPQEGVYFLSAAWNRERLLNYFRRADLFVLPSRLETWGDVLIEAMAFSLPCIGVREAAMPEIIDDGKTGLLVDAEDIDGLASALKKLFGDFTLRQKFGEAARMRVENFFTWDHIVRLMKPHISAISA